MWVAFANAKATHIFFSKNISVYAIFDDENVNDTLTNDIVVSNNWAQMHRLCVSIDCAHMT